jgi:ADP-ribosylglycohydrolase
MDRVAGAVIGSAVGDALGAPFEFGPPGALSRGEEMVAGGGWDPGEATDDTQMAVHLAESLLERGLDLADIFARFQRWAAAEPKDIGLQTEIVLTSGLRWDEAATDHRLRLSSTVRSGHASAARCGHCAQRTPLPALCGPRSISAATPTRSAL